MDIRKNLIILIFVLSGIFLILLVFNFQGPKNQGGQLSSPEKKETGAALNQVKISKSEVDFFNLSSSGDRVIFYEKINSGVYESGLDGKNIKELAKIPQALEVEFSPAGKEIIITLLDASGQRKIYFDLFNSKKSELHRNIKSVAFSPDGRKIAYHFYDPKTAEGNISISNPDGSDFVNIFKTRISELKILWPQNNFIVFYKNNPNSPTDVFSITLDGKNLNKLLGNVGLSEIKWSRNENVFIASIRENGDENLIFKDISGKIVDTGLKISAKVCDFPAPDNGLICVKDGEILKVDFQKNIIAKLASGLDFKPTNLSISSLEDYLIFIEANQKLYTLNIKNLF